MEEEKGVYPKEFLEYVQSITKTLPKQNAGEVAIQSFGILMIFCTFVKLTFFNSRTSLRQITL
jgi:hypothetical protein